MEIKVTSLVQGPFVILMYLVNDEDKVPYVYGPEGGFKTKAEAEAVIRLHEEVAKEGQPVRFEIAGLRDPSSLKQFMSF